MKIIPSLSLIEYPSEHASARSYETGSVVVHRTESRSVRTDAVRFSEAGFAFQ